MFSPSLGGYFPESEELHLAKSLPGLVFNSMHPACAFTGTFAVPCSQHAYTPTDTSLLRLCSWEELAAPVLAVYRPTQALLPSVPGQKQRHVPAALQPGNVTAPRPEL